MCYQQEFIAPPLESVVVDNGVVRSKIVTKKDSDRLLHIINMFLEMFGSCEIVDFDKKPVSREVIRVVQWRILPPGKYPWCEAKKHLERSFQELHSHNRETIEQHHRIVTKFNPEFMAIGEDGFDGYIVYGYPRKKVYVFESNQIDNATYVFDAEWEALSKLTKRDLIQAHLYQYRLIHNSEWENRIEEILKNEK